MPKSDLMGLSISDLLNPQATSFQDYSGKILAIDAYNTLYQFLTSIRQPDGTPLSDTNGNPTGHLTGLFYRTTKLLEAGVKPVFVFDGTPPEFKRATLEKRHEIKQAAHDEMEAALKSGDFDAAKKFSARTVRLTKTMALEAQELLKFMGVPTVQAPSEGEACASVMVREGIAYAVASQDYDALLFGTPRLIRNLSISGKRRLPGRNEFVEAMPEMLVLADVLSTNGLTQKQLIWIGILIGNDFNSGIKGIGPKKALKIVKECKSLEDIVAYARAELKYEFPEDVFAIERFFLDPPAVHDEYLEFGKIDKEGIANFLCRKHDFSQERVERTIDALAKKVYEKKAQKGLGEWF